MQDLFIEFVLLILIILALVMVANKLKLAYPIVLKIIIPLCICTA